MNHFDLTDTLIIIRMIVFYIAFTSWLTLKLRSKSSSEFMEGSRAACVYRLYFADNRVYRRKIHGWYGAVRI